MSVAKILQSKGSAEVVTIAPDRTVAEAAQLLSERRIGSLVVSTDGIHAEGILSERDIVREVGRRGRTCLDDKVSALMTADLVCAKTADRARDILGKMTEGRFRHMPVVDDGGKMIGIVTLGDVVKYRLDAVTAENEALEGMIMGF